MHIGHIIGPGLLSLFVSVCDVSAVLAECSDMEFRCDNGQCIDASQLCDFHVDCYDESDERHNICGRSIHNID